MLAHVDGKNFYASCHCIFQPELEGKPLIVLSNRDGNVVARSDAAKALGIKMAQPFFETKELREQQEIAVFSSNYELYGDISSRLMSILTQFAPDVEVYSIDEAFLQLEEYMGAYPSYQGLGQAIRQTVKQWLRLPVGVGIAPTKTLAKVANKLAKQRSDGVCVLDTPEAILEALETFPIEDLWGVGGRSASKLKKHGLKTAAQLRDVPDDWIRQLMTVNGVRLVHELRGFPCKLLEVSPPAKKSIIAAPSFGDLQLSLDILADALTTHLARACEKLRRQDSLCGAITVFVHTNPFRKTPGNRQPARQYSNSTTVVLPHPTSSTPELLNYALSALESIFAYGYHYKKVGVMLTGLVSADYRQKGVFVDGPNEKLLALSSVVDKLNSRFGQDKLRLASQLYNPDWPMKPAYLSKRYTTRWDEILTVS